MKDPRFASLRQAVQDLRATVAEAISAPLLHDQPSPAARERPLEPTVGRQGMTTFADGKALWRHVRDMPEGSPVARVKICSFLHKTSAFLTKHQNPSSGSSWREDKLVRTDSPRGTRGYHYTRESVLSWLQAYFQVSKQVMEMHTSGTEPKRG